MAGRCQCVGMDTHISRIVHAMSGMLCSQFPINEKYTHQKTLLFCSTNSSPSVRVVFHELSPSLASSPPALCRSRRRRLPCAATDKWQQS